MKAAILVTALAAVGGCHSVPLNAQWEGQPTEDRLPSAVGILFLPEFRDYTFTEWSSGIEPFFYPIGDASTKLLDQAFGQIFEQTVLVKRLDQLKTDSTQFAGVIEPAIEQFEVNPPKDSRYVYRAAITYRFTLYSRTGERLATWTVSGSGAKPTKKPWQFSSARGAAADLALQNAVSRLVFGFREIPEIRPWLEALGLRRNQ